MTPTGAVTEASEGVVALLLDDLAPPRLGTFLKGARKQRSLTRREVAGRVGTTSAELRQYERGDVAVPAHVIAALAECYGPALTAQFATRVPLIVDADRIVAGADVAPLDVEGDELERYAQLVQRVRHAQPGDPIALRAADLVALSRALGHDSDHIEARIVELLGCTQREARSLHREIVRRKLVVPVAGLVTGLAVVTGVGVAAATTGPNRPDPSPPAATQPAGPIGPAQGVAAPSGTGATGAPDVPTTVAGSASRTTAAPSEPAAAHDVAPSETPTTEPATTDAPAPSDPPSSDSPAAAPVPVPHPVITTDTTPMSIPAHESVTIIQP